MTFYNWQDAFLIVVVTFLFSTMIMFVMKKVAHYIGAVDIPRDNRRLHKNAVPKMGGLGIFLTFLFGYVLFGHQSIQINSILIGSFIIIITGIIDDINPLKARHKLIGQLAAALLIPLYGNIVLTEISAFGIFINFGILSVPVTVIFILAIVNCINLIDGMDGLSGGISSIYFLTIGIIAITVGSVNGLDFLLTFIMLGSTLGFLAHNFPPAKIFAGDTGSMFLGYIIAVIALLGFKNVTLTSFVVPLLLLGVPIFDTACAIIRRKLKGQPISMPDKSHLHHQLVNITSSTKKSLLIIYFIDILFAIASLAYVLKGQVIGIISYSILLLIIIWFLVATSIIRDKDREKAGKSNNKKKNTNK